jgi:hypothetical protein
LLHSLRLSLSWPWQNKTGKERSINKKVTKQEWIALFKDTGLSDAMMKKWHHLFERRHPEGHQDFLRWIGCPMQKLM